MNWSSFSAAVLVDMTIVGLAFWLLGACIVRGTFKTRRRPRTGHYLLVAGVVTTALYYLADLMSITVLPAFSEPETTFAVMDVLRQRLRVPVTLASFAFIVAGILVAARGTSNLEEKIQNSDQRATHALQRTIDSENRFRSMVEHISDSVYCFEFSPPINTSLPIHEQISRSYEGILVECNNAYARSVGVQRPADIVGKRYESMQSAFGSESHDRLFFDFIRGGYRLIDQENRSVNEAGEQSALLLNIAGVVKNGELQRIWGSEKDLLAQLDTEKTLVERARFRDAVAEISLRLMSTPDSQLGSAITASLQQVAKFALADRSALLWFDDQKTSTELLYYWSERGPAPWLQLEIDRFPWTAEQILRGEIVAIDSVSDLPDDVIDKQVLISLGLKSVAGIPMIVSGKVIGAVNFATKETQKTWSVNELQDMQVIANLMANVVNRLRLQKTLHDRNRFQKAVAEISERLILSPDNQLEFALKECLHVACTYSVADRVTLVWFNSENDRADLLYFWSEAGPAPLSKISADAVPWIAEQILRGETVVIPSVANLSDDLADKSLLTEQGIKSITVVPMAAGGEVVGTCGFSNLIGEKSWSAQDLHDAEVVSKLLANVVSRLQAQTSLDAALAELRQVKDRLEAENVYLRHEIQSTHDFNELIGESRGLIECLRQAAQVAPTNTTVLVQGETGTGKELIARAIHERSNQSDRALVKVNCAALPQNLIESELFGYEKGAFTGAVSRKRGRFDLANGGTLFLDEIGDLPLDLQGKLLRVLQDGEFDRLGGTKTVSVDVRIVAATNRKLQTAVDSGDFRADLYYRINTFPITLPPLRDRREDIPMLTDHFITKHAQPLGKDVTGVSTIMMEQMMQFAWPGNVRELESVVQRALISARGPVLQLAEPLIETPMVVTPATIGTVNNPLDLRSAQKEHIAAVLVETGWKIAGSDGAAAILGIPPSTLRSKMKKLGIQRVS